VLALDQAPALAAYEIAPSPSPTRPAASRTRSRPPAQAPEGLTAREREVTALVAQGLSNAAIAERLVLSARTVEMHVSHALHKLGLTTRTQLATWAIQQGLASPDDPA